MSFLRDLKIAVRSLSRARALWITVAVTLALGIGANAAIFSVVRGVLLRPLGDTIVVMPPLAIDEELLDRLGEVLYNGIAAIAGP